MVRAEEGILREVRNRNANEMLVFRKQKLGLTEGRKGTNQLAGTGERAMGREQVRSAKMAKEAITLCPHFKS